MEDFMVNKINEEVATHVALFVYCDPVVFEEVVKNHKWRKAMDEEIAAIEHNNTWELTHLPKGHQTIGVK